MAGNMNVVVVAESEHGPYGQNVTAGRHTFEADEPNSAGGQDSGPSPYDYLMAGLGACTAMRLRSYAHRHNLALRQITIELRHETIDAGAGTNIDEFHRLIYLDGDLTEEQRLELFKAADHCAVSQTLRNSSLIETRLAPAILLETAVPETNAA